MENLNIIQLDVENIKRIKVAKVVPSDGMVVIEGKNEQGKTSILDSIAYVLGGKTLIPENPIRKGQDKAQITVNIGNYIITRHWAALDKSYLKIVSIDGFVPKKPQDFLNGLVGNLTFDPLSFVSKEKNDRIKILKIITKLDFTNEDLSIENAIVERRDNNRDLDKTKKELSNYTNLPKQNDIRDRNIIQKDIDIIKENNFKIDQAKRDFLKISGEKNKGISDIQIWKSEIEKLTKMINNQLLLNTDLDKELKNKEEISKQEIGPIDSLNKEMESCNLADELKFKLSRKVELENALKVYIDKKDKIQKDIDDNEIMKKDKLRNIKMPIEGLSFGKDDVLYQNNEFSEISKARQIEISMSIAMAENPKLKICMIKDGSLLDKDSFSNIAKIAKQNDFQVWLERVADSPSKDTIYIEDGLIKGE